jgi:hypothetical protein
VFTLSSKPVGIPGHTLEGLVESDCGGCLVYPVCEAEDLPPSSQGMGLWPHTGVREDIPVVSPRG